MTSKKKLAIADYGMKTIKNWEALGKDIYIYSMDGYPYKRAEGSGECAKYDMASHVGLPNCHCCDCFIFTEDSISLIEEMGLLDTKKKVDKVLSGLNIYDKDHDDQKDNLTIKLVVEYIIRDNISKMYGSMLVLCNFSHYCEVMKNHTCLCNETEEKKYEYWLVIPAPDEINVRGIDMFKKELQEGINKKLKEEMKSRLRSVARDFVKGVRVLVDKKYDGSFENEIRKNAISADLFLQNISAPK